MNDCHSTGEDELLENNDTNSDEFEVAAPRWGPEQNEIEQDDDVLLMAVVSGESCSSNKGRNGR